MFHNSGLLFWRIGVCSASFFLFSCPAVTAIKRLSGIFLFALPLPLVFVLLGPLFLRLFSVFFRAAELPPKF